MDNNIEEIKRAALYIRVSTEDQMELSPDAQQRLLLDYAKAHNMLVDKEYIYIEGGRSGRHADKRPEFQNMIAAAKANLFDVILVWKYSRFARNQEESIVYKSLLQRNGVEVISISEPMIDGPFGSLIERIIEWMDEYYSIRLSGEVMRGMTEKARRGGYQAQFPIGYKMVGNKKDGYTPEIVPEEADFVRFVFNEYESGKDLTSIARKSNDLGYRTRRGNLWEYRTIRYILQNPFYIGKVRWNRAKHSSHIENDPSEIIISDGIHEPIIDIDQWNNVQGILKKKINPYAPRTSSNRKHWLSGMIKCSICGASLGFNCRQPQKKSGKIGAFFQCGNYSKGKHKISQTLMVHTAEECVISALENILINQQITFTIRKSSLETSSLAIKLHHDLDKITEREKRCKIAFQEGIDTLEEYRENKAQLCQMRDDIETKLSKIETDDISDKEAKERMLAKINSTLSIIKDENSDNEVKRNAIIGIIDKIIYIKDEKRLDICYRLDI